MKLSLCPRAFLWLIRVLCHQFSSSDHSASVDPPVPVLIICNKQQEGSSPHSRLVFQMRYFFSCGFFEENFTVWKVMHTLTSLGCDFEACVRRNEDWCLVGEVWCPVIYMLLSGLWIIVVNLSKHFEKVRHVKLVQKGGHLWHRASFIVILFWNAVGMWGDVLQHIGWKFSNIHLHELCTRVSRTKTLKVL